MRADYRKKLHQRVAGFALYGANVIPTQIENARTILSSLPRDLTNPVLCYVLNFAIKGILDSLLNELAQAADLLDKALKDFGEAGLEETEEIKDMRRVRNTLIAHGVEVALATGDHVRWYNRKYGSHASALTLMERVTQQLVAVAGSLMNRRGFTRGHGSVQGPRELQRKDIEALIAALKQAGLY